MEVRIDDVSPRFDHFGTPDGAVAGSDRDPMLIGNTSFAEVEIEVGVCTRVQISAVEFERLTPEDTFAYV